MKSDNWEKYDRVLLPNGEVIKYLGSDDYECLGVLKANIIKIIEKVRNTQARSKCCKGSSCSQILKRNSKVNKIGIREY